MNLKQFGAGFAASGLIGLGVLSNIKEPNTDEQNPQILKRDEKPTDEQIEKLKAAGHGKQVFSCGHVETCRCSHGSDPRLTQHHKEKCFTCREAEQGRSPYDSTRLREMSKSISQDMATDLTQSFRNDFANSLKLNELFGGELNIIQKAAFDNKCNGELYNILLAIRKSESGGNGKEFGILVPQANNLDKQARWCAATIVKNHKRWKDSRSSEDFITFLGNRYCPTSGPDLRPAERELNKNWIKNVTAWTNKIRSMNP
jgi:hypothetical protein